MKCVKCQFVISWQISTSHSLLGLCASSVLTLHKGRGITYILLFNTWLLSFNAYSNTPSFELNRGIKLYTSLNKWLLMLYYSVRWLTGFWIFLKKNLYYILNLQGSKIFRSGSLFHNFRDNGSRITGTNLNESDNNNLFASNYDRLWSVELMRRRMFSSEKLISHRA